MDVNTTVGNMKKGAYLLNLFEQQALANPAAVAIIHGGQNLSYQKLNELSNQLANYLKQQGVKNETPVPICVDRSIWMVVSMLGVLKAGAAYVPIDPTYPQDRINYMLEDTNAPLILCNKKSRSKIKNVTSRKIVEIDTDWKNIVKHSTANPDNNITGSQLAYIIYTSGSTGKPKGVMIEHRNACSFITWCLQEFSKSVFKVVYASTSICFDLSVFEIFYTLSAGKAIRILDSGLNIETYLPKDRGILLNTVPGVIDNLLKINTDLSHVNVINIAGEPVPVNVVQGLDTDRIEVRNLYGPTEDTTYSTIFRLRKNQPVLIGKPITGTQLYILDSNNQLCPDGSEGEICLGGDGLARGYLNLPELTAQKFIVNPIGNSPNSRLYKTGDLGRILPDGNVEYMDRMDDQVKIRGYRIELGEIETTLSNYQYIQQSVVLAKADNEGTKKLLSYYVPDWDVIKTEEQKYYQRQVDSWKDVYETEYTVTDSAPVENEEFDIGIWKNSFTGLKIGDEQMSEWLDDIVSAILSESPGVVLEIGCGTGLIFYRLAGKVTKYYGTDLSGVSINRIKARVAQGLKDYGPVEFWPSPAHEISLPDGEKADTIILNSISQHFPGEGYMNDVIAKSLPLLKKGGRIIIGDVRDNRLLKMFKLRLHLQKSYSGKSLQEVNWSVEQDVLKEEELCFSPEYFYNLKTLYPQISHIAFEWKQANHINELTLYRYNVIIYVKSDKPIIDPEWKKWSETSVEQIKGHLLGGIKILALKDAPNPRLWKEKLLNDIVQQQSISDLNTIPALIETEDEQTRSVLEVINTAKTCGYRYRFLLDEELFKINLLFEKTGKINLIQDVYADGGHHKNGRSSNIPLFSDISSAIKKDIRTYLQGRLPEYMIPQEYIPISKLPLTNNGKIDRRFLSQRDDVIFRSASDYQPATTAVQQKLVEIWQQLLNIEHIGINDNFFELGGHSLLAMKIISAIRQKIDKNIVIDDLFVHPDIAALSAYIEKADKKISRSLVPIKVDGSKIPLYIVCGSGGTVFKFREFANMLDADQPVYGLQQPTDIRYVDEFPDTMEGIAARYIEEMMVENPDGPYALSGHCLGGIIAFEMAKQLHAMGKKVLILAIFDQEVPKRKYNFSLSLNNLYHLPTAIKEYVSKISVRVKFKVFLMIKHPKQAILYQIGKIRSLASNKEDDNDLVAFNEITKKLDVALANYQIQPYKGDLIVFHAKEHYYFMDKVNQVVFKEMEYGLDTWNGWKKYARSVTLHEADGEHSGMFEKEYAAGLAKTLQSYLNQGIGVLS